MEPQLLTRDAFRAGVFQRDGNLCVICKKDGQDAHHIMERRLFADGGYYLENGATLCGQCHIEAEETILTTEQIREAAGITRTILPPHLYDDQRWDKWANPILDSGMRLRGELFDDESVQKILSCVLHLFTNRIKYPRTYHVFWSPGATNDDRMMPEEVINKWNWEVIITEKMDGENTTFYNDGLHARSLDYEPHPSRNQIKALHAQIAHNIPDDWRICCENLTAKHSIKYTNLKSICQVFSIWNGTTCLSWDDTVTFAGVLGLETVPVIWRGIWDANNAEKFGLQLAAQLDSNNQEGYVIRPAGVFPFKDFRNVVGKYVRAKHIVTHGHWMRQKIEYNEVKSVL
jgi:hypothetical protein